MSVAAEPAAAPVARTGVSLAATYWSYLGALGVYGPYLAVYLKHDRNLSGSAAAYVWSFMTIIATAASPFWTLIADRLGSADRVLRLVSIGALLSFALLVVPSTGWVFVVLALGLFNFFRAPGGALIDVVALDWVARRGGAYGRIRAWGTIGYALSAVGMPLLMKRFGAGSMVTATLVLLVLMTLATFFAPRASRTAALRRESLLPGFKALARRPRFAIFLATAFLNQIGLAPYDNLFPDYLSERAGAEFTSGALALGTAAELSVMLFANGIIKRLGFGRTLVIVYLGSALRWLIIAFSRGAWPLTLAQSLHGLTYGAFYVAGVSLVDAEAPPEVRASAQGIFSMVTWGLAASASLALAGTLQRVGGMPLVFAVAAGASVLGALLALRLCREAPALGPEVSA